MLTPAEIARATNTPHWFSDRTIVDQLEQHGLTWKAYMQSMPSVGFTGEYAPVIGGTPHKLYAQKHDPFMYFSDIRNNPARYHSEAMESRLPGAFLQLQKLILDDEVLCVK